MVKVAMKPMTLAEIEAKLDKLPQETVGAELSRLSPLFEQARMSRDWDSLVKIGATINLLRTKAGQEPIEIPAEPPPRVRKMRS